MFFMYHYKNSKGVMSRDLSSHTIVLPLSIHHPDNFFSIPNSSVVASPLRLYMCYRFKFNIPFYNFHRAGGSLVVRAPDSRPKAWVRCPYLRVHTEYLLVESVGPKVLWAESRMQGTGENFPPLQFHALIRRWK
ncbi:hypothetical protein TNCV_1159871 [Trichonephila clavipes]|nr:hypothetical protein TNCV_1159871 [Trichonephila clavipes]